MENVQWNIMSKTRMFKKRVGPTRFSPKVTTVAAHHSLMKLLLKDPLSILKPLEMKILHITTSPEIILAIYSMVLPIPH